MACCRGRANIIINSVFLTLTWVCLGLFLELNGPTFKDLQIKTGGSTEDISKAITGRSVGTFLGAVLGGIMVELFERYCNMMVGCALSTAAIATAFAPWSPNPSVYWVVSMAQGLCEGVIDIAGHRLILTMWMENAASPLQALHLGFGIGSLIGPILSDPFLAVLDDNVLANQTNSSISSITSYGKNTEYTDLTLTMEATTRSIQRRHYVKESRIEILYSIVAVFTACISVSFYFFQFCFRRNENTEKPKKDKEKPKLKKLVKETIDPANCAGGKRLFGIQIFLLMFFFFFNAIGDERMYGKFIRNFSIDYLKFDGSNASVLNSSYWICITVGRFTGFVVSRWIPIRYMIIIEACGVFISSVILNIFAYYSSIMLWICTLLIGFFLAPLIPSGIAWGDYYVRMTGLAIMFTLQGGSVGSLCYLWIIGHIYETYGYRTFLYQVVAGGALLVVIAAIMTFVGRKHGSRFEQNDVVINVNNNEATEKETGNNHVTKF